MKTLRRIVLATAVGLFAFSAVFTPQAAAAAVSPSLTKEPPRINTSPLPAPARLMATVAGGKVSLSWQDTGGGQTGFELERAPGTGGPFVRIASPGAGVTTYIDAAVQAGGTYTYRVRAVVPSTPPHYSPYSGQATVTLPAAAKSVEFTTLPMSLTGPKSVEFTTLPMSLTGPKSVEFTTLPMSLTGPKSVEFTTLPMSLTGPKPIEFTTAPVSLTGR